VTPSSIVVVSPHSDDGVLSLGAAMASWARARHRVELLTVLALDPDSQAATRGWDRRAGFETEGGAARARRAEDRAACALVGAEPSWRPFGSVDFDRHGDVDDVWKAIAGALEEADLVLVPGSPLTHPDHVWIHDLVAARLPADRIGLYAEQPYTFRDGSAPYPPVSVGARDRLAKWRALRAYRSQLPLLGLQRGLRTGTLRLASAPERIRWPDGHDGRPV
jgi:LmbE family N-acetylglucosaminyl deacetylase